MADFNRCVCCGKPVPEGQQVCSSHYYERKGQNIVTVRVCIVNNSDHPLCLYQFPYDKSGVNLWTVVSQREMNSSFLESINEEVSHVISGK